MSASIKLQYRFFKKLKILKILKNNQQEILFKKWDFFDSFFQKNRSIYERTLSRVYVYKISSA